MRREKYTIEQMKKALKATGGFITLAADKLGCEYHTVTKYIKRYPELQEYIEYVKERQLDFTEAKLITKINEGETTCLLFYLKCKGKHRGYVERQEINATVGVTIDDFLKGLSKLSDADREAFSSTVLKAISDKGN